MTYQQCIDYFYSQLPMFHRTGAAALKPNLDNIRLLCGELGNPHLKFKSIHIAGTNGKGSCSHMLAAVLQTAGYKTGLFTSPHIKDFRERIRVDGEMIPKQEVVAFVKLNRALLDQIKPSFFELTVALGFQYFAKQKVDIAVIEVGLGGRLDSTNIVEPLASLITNIGFDHSDLLGDTLEAIAKEKAGIIKPGVPVIVGERQPDTEEVFLAKAQECSADLYFAQDYYRIHARPASNTSMDVFFRDQLMLESLELQLNGPFQSRNLAGVLQTLRTISPMGFSTSDPDIRNGLSTTVELTGIKGRWQVLATHPTIICDTGHNMAALECTMGELARLNQGTLHLVVGFVRDKDIRGMLGLLPKDAIYYFCAANVPRSLVADELAQLAREFYLQGVVISHPNEALAAARNAAKPEDLIFVGGSTFVVAELSELN